jgi:hypothetical protein
VLPYAVLLVTVYQFFALKLPHTQAPTLPHPYTQASYCIGALRARPTHCAAHSDDVISSWRRLLFPRCILALVFIAPFVHDEERVGRHSGSFPPQREKGGGAPRAPACGCTAGVLEPEPSCRIWHTKHILALAECRFLSHRRPAPL